MTAAARFAYASAPEPAPERPARAKKSNFSENCHCIGAIFPTDFGIIELNQQLTC